MAGLAKLSTSSLLALLLITACDSTSPASDRMLHIQGEILEAGQPPMPPLDVEIQAWPALSDGSDIDTVRTDSAGGYSGELGPFAHPRVDRLRVRVTQNDCGLQATTELQRRDLALGDGDALLPTLSLSYRLPPLSSAPARRCVAQS
jgi:hypothetical protein